MFTLAGKIKAKIKGMERVIATRWDEKYKRRGYESMTGDFYDSDTGIVSTVPVWLSSLV